MYWREDMDLLMNVSRLLVEGVESINKLGDRLQLLFKQILGPVFAVVGIAAVVYAIVLGINYAKAEDADARKKVQSRLIGALVGAAIILIGATLFLAVDWEKMFEDFSGEDIPDAAIKYMLTVMGI